MGDFAARNKALNEKMRELKAEMQELGKAAFKEESESIFEDNPELEYFRWTQYSPYFNDGDECTFHVHSDYFWIGFTDGTDNDGEEIDAWSIKYYADKEEPYSADPRVTVELAERISGLVGSIDEDVMEEMFGNHVQVEVHRDGTVNADETYHD